MMLRSFNQTVGRMMRAVIIPNKWIESILIPSQSMDVPGKRPVRLSPSNMMNSTQYDYKKMDKDSSNFTLYRQKQNLRVVLHLHIVQCTKAPARKRHKPLHKPQDHLQCILLFSSKIENYIIEDKICSSVLFLKNSNL